MREREEPKSERQVELANGQVTGNKGKGERERGKEGEREGGRERKGELTLYSFTTLTSQSICTIVVHT